MKHLFNTGDTATGNYTFDSGTLFIDSVRNRIGIGTLVPNSSLHVVGNMNLSGTMYTETGINLENKWGAIVPYYYLLPFIAPNIL